MAVKGVFELPDGNASCEVEPGSVLTEAAEAAGVVLNVSCGGVGRCGGCAVDLLEGVFEDADGEPIALMGGPKRVLGCRVRILEGGFRVRVPRHSLVAADEKIVVDFEHLPAWRLSPAVAKVFCRLPAPTLADQTGDVERIRQALREHGFRHVSASLPALRQAPEACRAGQYAATATLVRDDDRWRLTRVAG